MDLKIFKKKNDKQTGEGSDIFEYQRLRDFEKVLFLEYQVKELIVLLKRKDNHIKNLNIEMEKLIEDYVESKQVKSLKEQITANQKTIKKYKDLFNEQLQKNK